MSIDTLFATAHAAMSAAGGDFFGALDGFYTEPDDVDPLPVSVFMTRGVQVLGDFGEVVGQRDEAELDLSAVTPAHGGELLVEFAPGAVRYKLDAELANDGVSSRWSLRRV